ncbi:MAG: response regulator transcription factor [Mariniphaga sp.]|nr:response regulator transcription factor [Mariniphaga sp.]
MESIRKINIVVVDDHTLFRKGLITLLNEINSTGSFFEASNGLELIDMLNKTNPLPDLILLDINMPVMDGVKATEIIKEKYPELKIIILSMENEEQLILHLIEKGVNGYLLKNCESEELERAIKMVMEKEYYFNHDISELIRRAFIHKSNHTYPICEFTRREQEVLELICKEFTTQQIANKFDVSPRTIESHRKNLIEKSGVKNLAGLIVFAIKNKIVKI